MHVLQLCFTSAKRTVHLSWHKQKIFSLQILLKNTRIACVQSVRMAPIMAVPDDKYADMRISCPSKTWDVHSNVVCPQSQSLDEQFDAGDMVSLSLMPGAQQLTPAKILNLPDADEVPVQAMIDFLYTGDYIRISAAQEALPDAALPRHAIVWEIAEGLEISGLSVLAVSKFEAECQDVWAEEYFAKVATTMFMDEGLMLWYEEMQCPMVNSLLKVARAHARELLSYDSPNP